VQFVGNSAHGLQIVDSATEASANLSRVTVSTAGATLSIQTSAAAGSTTGAVVIPTGNTAPTVTTGVTYGTAGTGGTGGTTTGTASNTLTAGVDLFNNATVANANFGGVAYTAPTLNTAATLYTTQANLTNATGDTLAFSATAGVVDTLVFTDQVGAASAMVVGANAVNGAAVTGLDTITCRTSSTTSIFSSYG